MTKKVVNAEESATPEEQDITQIDGNILDYVRERMHCKTVTLEVRRQAALFQRDIDKMEGW